MNTLRLIGIAIILLAIAIALNTVNDFISDKACKDRFDDLESKVMAWK